MIQPHERPDSAQGVVRGLAWRGFTFVVLVVVIGCQSPNVPFDPFLAGRTTIPPPGTAVAPTAVAPYYDAAPPVVTVPGATTIYPPPGIAPAPVPASSLPPAGSGRFPRGVSVPQTSTQPARDRAQLAGWQPADPANLSDLREPTITAASDGKPAVVRASHEASSPEPPIRIVEPKESAGTR